MSGRDLYYAAYNGDIDKINRLIESGVDLDWNEAVILHYHTTVMYIPYIP